MEPLEIARRLTREADERKIITLNRVYVPNEYVVGLHPADMAVLEPIAPELEAEFQRYVGEWAVDRDYAVTGPIKVSLTAQERVGRNRMKVHSSLEDIRAAEEAARKGLGFQLEVEETVGCLEVEEGPDAGRAFTLLNRRMTIGSGDECDIRLKDPELPECYAYIMPAQGTWRIEELPGQPPIRINDRFQHEGLLKDGDAVQIGANIVGFRVADVRSVADVKPRSVRDAA